MAFDGAPGAEVRTTPAEVKGADPGKLIMRLENRLSGLESLRSRSLSEIGQLTTEAARGRDDIARPFPPAGQLAAARDRILRLQEKLRETTAPSRHNSHGRLPDAYTRCICGKPAYQDYTGNRPGDCQVPCPDNARSPASLMLFRRQGVLASTVTASCLAD